MNLINTIEMMLQVQVRRRKKKRMQPKRRSPQEQKVIDDAKSNPDGKEQYDRTGGIPLYSEM